MVLKTYEVKTKLNPLKEKFNGLVISRNYFLCFLYTNVISHSSIIVAKMFETRANFEIMRNLQEISH